MVNHTYILYRIDRQTNNKKSIIERIKHNGSIIVYELELLWSICYFYFFELTQCGFCRERIIGQKEEFTTTQHNTRIKNDSVCCIKQLV